MKTQLDTIHDELLCVVGPHNARLSNQLLDLKFTDIHAERSVRIVAALLKIREAVTSIHPPLARELGQWIQQNIVVVTFCPHCGAKRDIIPIGLLSNNIRDIVDNSHRYYCGVLRPYYPNRICVYYAFSYVDEYEIPVEIEDLLWYEAGVHSLD
jgi:hypothetical protein